MKQKTHLLSLLAGDAADGPPLLIALAPLLFVSPVFSVFSEDPLKNFLIADVIFSLDLEDMFFLSERRKRMLYD